MVPRLQKSLPHYLKQGMEWHLLEVVQLCHPREWIQAITNVRTLINTPPQQSLAWKLAEEIALFLRDQYGCDRVAVSGDLVTQGYLTPWSALVIVAWGLLGDTPNSPYTNAYSAIYQMYPDHHVFLIDAACPDGNKEAAWVQQAIELG